MRSWACCWFSLLSQRHSAHPLCAPAALRFDFRSVEFGFARSFFLSPFPPCFSRGITRGRECLLPPLPCRGEPQKISRVSVDFFGGTVTRRAAKPGQSLRRQGGGAFTRLPCLREQA